MKKVIKIFLGSSITEFRYERMDIENFISRISNDFEDRYNVKILPLLCESFDDALSKIRKQEEYNEKVRESDMCFFIFFTKAGEYTKEEFDAAREQFEKTGKPKIYTYFKVLGEEKAEDNLYDFMEELDKLLGHYYGTFDHIDTVKLRILLNLKLQEMDFLEIKAEGDTCFIDGKKALPLSNVSEFANNKLLNDLKRDFDEVDGEYLSLKPKYVKNECSESEENRYIKIASKRAILLEMIEELQKNIFNMSLRMCRDEARGDVTARQKEAYRLFKAGDLEGANNILDFAQIKNDYQRRRAIREAEQKKDAEIFIREGKTKIDILTAMTNRASRFEEIEEIYDEITSEAVNECVEFYTANDFAWFLYRQNKRQKAYDIAKKAEEIALDDEEKARLHNTLGAICRGFPAKKTESEEHYKKAIEIRERLAKQNPERFEPDLARSYYNAGVFYYVRGNKDAAEEYYKKAIEIREKLAKQDPERFEPDLARSYNNAGVFYNDYGNKDAAEEYYKKAIEIYERIAKQNPERFEPYLARSYYNAGVFYDYHGIKDAAEEYYKKALELAKKHPDHPYCKLIIIALENEY